MEMQGGGHREEHDELSKVDRLTAWGRQVAAWARERVVECGIPRCRRFHVSHRLLVRTPGILLSGQWYCGQACFADALAHLLREEAVADQPSQRRRPRMPYRLILLSRGLVSEEQLGQARLVQEDASLAHAPLDLGEALVLLGHVSEDQLAAARASEAGYALYSGTVQRLSPAYKLPPALVERYEAVPVHHATHGGRLLVGFKRRVEPRLLRAIAQVTGCRTVQPCLLTPSRYHEEAARLRSFVPPAHERGRQPLPLAQNSRSLLDALVSQSAHLGADELRLARVKGLLWLRFFQRSGIVDHLVDLEQEENLPAPGARALETEEANALAPK